MSERKRIEEALRNSEELYRALYEDNPFMYFTLDVRGTILSVNRYGAEQLGFSVEELLGRPILDVFREEDKERVSRRLDECLLEPPGQTCGWEACKVRKDGSTLWVRETVRAVRSPGDDTVVLVVCEDITERKQAQEALQESNNRIRNILESITDAFFALDSEWRFTYVNSEAEHVLQRPREELLGKNIWEEFPEAVGSAFYREYHRALRERTTVEFEEYYPPLETWVGVRAYPSEYGLSVYFRDVTEHRRAEERLLFQAQLLKQVKAAVIATDLEGTVVHWNDYAEKLYGWSREEALGRNVVTELVVGPAEAGVAEEIMERLRAGETWEGEFVVRRKDGSTFPTHVTNSLIYDSQGGAVGIIGVSVDIAERKKAEEERDRLFTLSLDLLCIAGMDGYFKRLNPAFEETLGFTNQELLAEPFAEFVHPEDRAATIGEVEKLSSGATTVLFENRYRCKDGTYVWLAWKAVPVIEEGLIYAAARNVTEQKRAEHNIRARARQQEAVADLGRRALAEPDLSALMDETVEVVARTLNLEYCELLELLPNGETLLLRSGVGWKEGLVGDAMVGANRDSLAGYTLLADEPVVVEDLRAESRFGQNPQLHEHGVTSGMSTVVRGREGPFGVLGAYTGNRRTFSRDDVNFLRAVANVLATAVERNNVEEEMREIRGAERQRMARAMHDEALQDVVYALQELQAAEAASGNGQDDGLREAADALRRSVAGLRSAIFDLRLDGDREQTLVEMLESLVELNRRSSPEREVELSVEEGFRSLLTRTKEVELLRLVQEALANVRRHSEARRVRVAVGTSGSKLYAEVSDDGRGFDPAQASAGMGTKGMRERARGLGGSLELWSKPGEGTRVRFEVTLERDAEEPKEARILLVEDHASFRQAVASVFEREPGFTVVAQAGSLAEARRMLDGVDIAIIDLALPDGYGGELIKDLRDANPGAMALVLSASLDRAETARAVESGAAGVLHKSVELDEVVHAVRRVRAGEMLLSPEEVVKLLRFASSRRQHEYESRQAIAQLTPREREVLQALAEGLDGPEIAGRLRISIPTERNHMASILAKLGVHSRLQALVFALRHNVVSVR